MLGSFSGLFVNRMLGLHMCKCVIDKDHDKSAVWFIADEQTKHEECVGER